MKKMKKIIASLAVSALSLCSIPFIGASAAPPPSNQPRIYIELTEDSTGIRADVIMENVPNFRNAVIGFDMGESWGCVIADENNAELPWVEVTADDDYIVNQWYQTNTNKRYACVSVGNVNSVEKNHNGVVASFYIEKTDSFELSDSGLNLYHGTYAEFMMITKADGTNLFEETYYNSPIMLEADEFMYGDVTGDGLISGSDAMWTLSTYNQYGRVKVTDLYNDYLPNIRDMKAAYAADVNKDGYIDDEDADIILYTYTQLSSGKNFDQIDGIVGEIDVYEVY